MTETPAFIKKEIIGSATLYLGDSYKIIPTLSKVDCIVMDPPYEFETSGGGIFRRGRDCMDRIEQDGIADGFDHTFLTQDLCDSVFTFCHNDQLEALIPWLSEKFGRYAVCAWHKQNPMPVANKHYLPDTEFYIHAWNESGYPDGVLLDKNRWILEPVGKESFASHPSIKPMNVMCKIMANARGKKILDPFMGTGTTGVAAVQFDKEFIGIERVEKYFDAACRRIECALKSPKRAAVML